MLKPGVYNIDIRKGRDFRLPLKFNMDLTGYQIKSQIRSGVSGTVLADFTVQMVAESAGEVTLSLTDTQTAAIQDRKGVYDVLLTDPDGLDLTYIEGGVSFIETCTSK